MNKNLLAIIPARSGSKGLPDKNIMQLNGHPLLWYSVKAAKESDLFCEIFVSTDSEKYAEISRKCGANVPFLRSTSLADDHSSTWSAVLEAVNKYQSYEKKFDYICLLQPTSPLRNKDDIIRSYRMLMEKSANSVVSVSEADHSPLWCNTLNKDLSLTSFIPENIITTPRQLLPSYYRINGAIYWVATDYLKLNTDIYRDKSYAYIMSKDNSVDIDDYYDFQLAEIIIKNRGD